MGLAGFGGNGMRMGPSLLNTEDAVTEALERLEGRTSGCGRPSSVVTGGAASSLANPSTSALT